MDGLLRDVRYSVRSLRKRPAFSLLVVLLLAVAIAANSSIFSIVNAVLLKPLSFKQPDQLVWIWAQRKTVTRAFFSIPNFIDTRDQNQTLAELAPFAIWPANLTGQGEAERLQGVRISANAMQMLGVEAAAGRALAPDDDNPNNARVVMLSYAIWQRRFGGANDVLGKTLTLNDDAYIVVGVLPSRFVIPNAETEIMVPLRMDQDPRRTQRGSNFLRLVARLKPGITPAQAEADLSTITNRLRDLYPDDNGNIASPRVLRLQDEVIGGYRDGLWLILAAVIVVLLIACANLASFQLARAALRHKEMAIRTALGAKRKVLIRQVLTESMLLAILGGGFGLLLSFWAKDLLFAMSPADFPRAGAVSIDGRVLLFSLLLTLFAGLGLGFAPAIQYTRTDLNSELKEGGRDTMGETRNRIRSMFIVSEIALSLMLLVAAGLLLKSFSQLRGVNPGFDANHILAVRFSLPAARYSNAASVKTFYDKIAPRIEALPGVEGVSAASALPLSGMIARTTFNISGRPALSTNETPFAQHRWVGPGYFETMKIPLIRGRDISDRDNEHAPGAILIDQSLQRHYFGGQDPLGAHVFINMGDGNPPSEYEVVGIVDDVKHMGLTDDPVPTLYGPIPQAPKSAVPFMANNLSLVVRTGIDPEVLAATVRKELGNVDVDIATAGVRPMRQYLAASMAARRFNMHLVMVFAITALVLAAAGMYAVIAYLVSQRTREIGIRLALGATPQHILRLMIGQGMKLTLIGVTIGFVGAFALTRLMRSLLFGVAPNDLMIFGISSFILIAVALLACFIPARRATKVDPLVALRYE